MIKIIIVPFWYVLTVALCYPIWLALFYRDYNDDDKEFQKHKIVIVVFTILTSIVCLKLIHKEWIAIMVILVGASFVFPSMYVLWKLTHKWNPDRDLKEEKESLWDLSHKIQVRS